MAIGIYSYTCILTNHSTHSSIPNTTILSTTSYPYALTMVVRVMCTYVSWCPWVMCIPVGLCVGGCASAIGCSRLQYFLVLHPEWAQYYSSLRLLQVLLHSSVHDTTTRTSYGTSISSYPSVSWSVSSCELHYNIPVRSRTGCCIAGTAEQEMRPST